MCIIIDVGYRFCIIMKRECDTMKFVENVNRYLSQMKIKQTYLSMRSGIDVKKLSRILTGSQDISGSDMEKIAGALGRKIEFFLQDDIEIPDMNGGEGDRVMFYIGKPDSRHEKMAGLLLEFVENMDVVLGAKDRFMNI